MPGPSIGGDSVCDEIKSGGVAGCLGIDQITWSRGGAIYEVWKCEPCCGSPVNFSECLYCAVCWWICGFCSGTKLYASSLGQTCSIVPHCLCCYFLPSCALAFTRYNLRKKAGQKGNLLGDIVCHCFLLPCALCQELRSASKQDWDLLPFKADFVAQPACKLLV